MSAQPSGLSRLFAAVTGSAESLIAVALLIVCVAVGGALWLLDRRETAADHAPSQPDATTQAPAVNEDAALERYQKKIASQMDQIDQQRKDAADEAQRRRAESLERQREAEEEARQAQQVSRNESADARMLDTLSREPAPQPAPAPAPKAAPAPVIRRAAVVRPAAIDWSSCKRPEYPDASVRRNEEGVVVVEVNLDASARITGSHIAQTSGHERLDHTTLDAVVKCRFTPETADGVARASVAVVRFTWKLRN